MFKRTLDEISYYPTDLFLSEHTHNSFAELEKLPWEFKEEMRAFLTEKFKFTKRKIEKGK